MAGQSAVGIRCQINAGGDDQGQPNKEIGFVMLSTVFCITRF